MGIEAGNIPQTGGYRLDNLRVPAVLLEGNTFEPDADGFATVTISIDDDGRFGPIQQAASYGIDMGGRIALPAFVDVHTHLDKGHIWPRQPNPDGSFEGALNAVGRDRIANWSADDVRARMNFGLRCAYAQGTKAIRTHLDSIAPQHTISWPVFAELREEWRGRIALEATPLFGIDFALDDRFLKDVAEISAPFNGPIGAVAYWVDGLQDGLDAMFRLASDTGRDLDFHVDETLDPQSRCLNAIAETAIRFGFEGKILCGHCCSICVHGDEEIERTLDRILQAGLAIVSLPMCNMYLQDRYSGRTPRYRGVTLLNEMRAHGIPVMVASDNTRDPFYAYGDLDLWEVYRSAVRTAHLDHPHGDWITTITSQPAKVMGLGDGGRMRDGDPADLVILRGRSWSECLSRSESARLVLRQGRAIETALPDYDELDVILGEMGHPDES